MLTGDTVFLVTRNQLSEILAIAFFSSMVITAICIHFMHRGRLGRMFLDLPTGRGLHAVPVPRVGGIGIFAGVWVLAGFWLQRDVVAAVAGLSVVLICISLLDDLRPLPALLRLVVHAAAAILVVLFWVKSFGLSPDHTSTSIRWVMSPAGGFAVVLAIVWMTNLYNFMDGADGLAGGMTLIGFGAYGAALMTWPDAGGTLGLLVMTLSGGAAGFLLFNFPPAKVFMGDAGAIPLGFLAITLGIHGNMTGRWPWWFAPLVFSPFIVDATATLLRRTAQGKKPWVAHRDHYYQRLILSGWGHRKTALVSYGLMAATACSALVAMQSDHAGAILVAWVIIYAVLLMLLEWHFHEKKNNTKNNERGAA